MRDFPRHSTLALSDFAFRISAFLWKPRYLGKRAIIKQKREDIMKKSRKFSLVGGQTMRRFELFGRFSFPIFAFVSFAVLFAPLAMAANTGFLCGHL